MLFNGKEAFAVGERILAEAHEDNFFEILPIEPISLQGENFDDTTIVPGFDRAEEKSVKAVQKHSINIDQVQHNRHIDQAYLLLGKSRYFGRRFFPALEAFNFLLKSGADFRTYTEGRIWREKTNIRLQNHRLAINNLRDMTDQLAAKNKFYPLANATMAEAYLNLSITDSALYYLKKAALHANKRKKKGRYFFISGQLYEQLNQIDSARWAYQQVIDLNRKTSRKLLIQSKIKQLLLNSDQGLERKIGALKKMLNNFENEPFEHSIHRALAKIYLQEGQDSTALAFYNASQGSPFLDAYTQQQNYRDLSDYNFEKGNYQNTGAYLDSLLSLMDGKSLEAKKLQRKRDNLSEIIRYEDLRKETDSILHLMDLSEEEQLSFFEAFLEEKTARAIQAKKTEKKGSPIAFFNRQKSAFYFYNSNLVEQGRQTYYSTWGQRPNIDFWRSSNVLRTAQVTEEEEKDATQVTEVNVFVEKPENFVALLPKGEKAKDSLINANHNTYLQLGMIYKEKFNDLQLAEDRLQHLLEQLPQPKIAVQGLYHLYKIYEIENPPLAEHYKARLIEQYPETAFAKLLLDPDSYSGEGIMTPEKLYTAALHKFQEQSFTEALESLQNIEAAISGNEWAPKVALLKAHTLGRIQGIEAWKKELTQVSVNFAASDEGKNALALLQQFNDTLPQTALKVYHNYKWIFPFKKSDTEDKEAFLKTLKNRIENFQPRWKVSEDAYDEEYIFIVVHGIRNQNDIDGWLRQDKDWASAISQTNNFVALATQYREYMINKNWTP